MSIIMIIISLVLLLVLINSYRIKLTTPFEVRKTNVEIAVLKSRNDGNFYSSFLLIVICGIILVSYWFILASYFSGLLTLLCCLIIIKTVYDFFKTVKIFEGEEMKNSVLGYFSIPIYIFVIAYYLYSLLT